MVQVANSSLHQYHSDMKPNHPDASNDVLHTSLIEMRAEHRDLDEAIQHMTANPPDDQLVLRRLKKRKLLIKDRITSLERMLDPDPDEYA